MIVSHPTFLVNPWAVHYLCRYMPVSVRVQGPGPAITLGFEDGATLDDLRDRIATELGIPASAQELRAGFPPQVVGAAGLALISSELGAAARVLVKSTGAAGPSSSGGGGAAQPPSGGGRKKPQAQRVQDGANPRDVQARAEAEAAAQAAAAADADEADKQLPAKRARTQTLRQLTPEESAAALLGDDAPKPRAPKPKGAAASSSSSSAGAAAASAGHAPPKATPKARAPKTKTAQQLASEYFLGASTAQAGGRGGAPSRDYLTDLAMVEHRVSALQARKYALEEVAPTGKEAAQLHASFKGTRKELCETVQLLGKEQIREVLAALVSRGSSSCGRSSSSHLLAPREMASRSPALFWSLAHAFDGDIEGGVRELQA